MVVPFKLDDLVPTRESAGQPDRGHCGLRSRVDHANFLDRGDPLADDLGHFHLEGVGDSKGEAILGDLVYGVSQNGRGVTQNGRPPGSDVVNQATTIDILNPASLGSSDKEGISVDVTEGPDGGVYSAGN